MTANVVVFLQKQTCSQLATAQRKGWGDPMGVGVVSGIWIPLKMMTSVMNSPES